jgi:transcriptional regulator with XRE-family HTH domain
MIPKSKRIGKYLKERREYLKLSQLEIATKLNYPNIQSISNWESGRSPVPIKVFKRLVKAYQISSSEWLSIVMTEIENKIRAHL